MSNDKLSASRSYSVPKGVMMETKRATIFNTLSQIANADLQIGMYRSRKAKETEKEKRAKIDLKIQQLEDGKDLNYEMLEFLDYRPGDEKKSFLWRLAALFAG